VAAKTVKRMTATARRRFIWIADLPHAGRGAEASHPLGAY
jgi:hypothetical protein